MENTFNIKRQLTYFIVPFALNFDYKKTKEILDNTDKWENKKISPINLLKHIDNLISNKDSKSNIGNVFHLSNAKRFQFGLPNNSSTFIDFKNKDTEFKFSIKDILLYIFETQVGFLVFDINYPKNTDLKSIITYNYAFKKIQYTSNNISFCKNKLNNEYQNIVMSDLVINLLSDLNVKTFFEGKHNLPGQTLVYNALLIDKKPEEKLIGKYLYWLRRSFKEGYIPSDDEAIKNNNEILKPFDNSYWGVSLEGVCNLVHTTDNENTNTFFSGNYFGNIKTTYFYTFMLALHQRYALLNLSILASEIKLTKNSEINIINELKEKIIMFNLRCSFRHVTNITHHSNLYKMIRKNLQIEELMAELQGELTTLSTMIEMEYHNENERKKAIEEKKQNRFNMVIVLATTAFVMVSTAADAWSVLNVFTDDIRGNIPSFKSLAYIIIISLIVLLGLNGLISFIKNGLWKKD
jgi:hypothetical protein